MKVWLIQRSEPTPHDNGGTQRAMRMGIIAQMLARSGHQVLWWTSTFDHYNRCQRFKDNTRRSVEKNYEIQYLRGCGYKRNMSLARLRENAIIARQFQVLADKESEIPDIILASMPTAELGLVSVNYGRKHGIPVVLDIRDLWPDVFFDMLPRVMHPLVRILSMPIERKTRKACAGATAIWGLSDAFVDWGMERANRPRSENDCAFAMGYLPKNIPEEGLEKGRNFWNDMGVRREDNQIILTFFGTLGRWFDFHPVAEALNILSQKKYHVKTVVCGLGENEKDIKIQTKQLNNIIFPGWVNEKQIRALLEISDIGLAPYVDSMSFIYSFPNKAAEYLSGSAPIALSLSKGVLHDLLIKEDCGFSYGGRPYKLAEQLQALRENPHRLQELQANAKKAYRKYFDANVVYRQLINRLEKIAGMKRNSVS